MLAASQESGTGRGASRGARVEIGEAHALGGKLVEDGGFNRTTVTADVAVAEVVNEEGDDVGFLVLSESVDNKYKGAKVCQKSSHVSW